MVTRLVLASGLTTPRILTDVDGGFTIDAYPFDTAIVTLAVFGFYVGKNRIRFGQFFCGLALTTACNR